MIHDWNGAQWIIVFTLASRLLFGLLVASGNMKTADQGPWPTYFGRRLADAALVGVLIWGGFF